MADRKKETVSKVPKVVILSARLPESYRQKSAQKKLCRKGLLRQPPL